MKEIWSVNDVLTGRMCHFSGLNVRGKKKSIKRTSTKLAGVTLRIHPQAQSSTECWICPFCKQAMPFLTVDAMIGNLACPNGREVKMFACLRKGNVRHHFTSHSRV